MPQSNSHSGCFACSASNTAGLQLSFQPSAGINIQHHQVEARFWSDSKFQGYPAQLHGGIIATLLDAAMTHCLFAQGIEAVTAKLAVRFLAPVPLRQEISLIAWNTLQRGRFHRLTAEIRDGQRLLASAEADFLTREKAQ